MQMRLPVVNQSNLLLKPEFIRALLSHYDYLYSAPLSRVSTPAPLKRAVLN